MKRLHRTASLLGVLYLLAVFGQGNAGELATGMQFEVADKKAEIVTVDALRYVENDYSKRFKFDSAENPKLKQLREGYDLEK